ncbi:hypothetical protein ABT301_29155 [Streptomyces sp. NPDC000987]|uniref:hypothetical protein n=1 Tax=Streptomyces sp. NPDC000987 TaxID=3154374 RepID=UPI00333108BA
MSTTMRLNRIAAEGTGGIFLRIHLADDRWISLMGDPGATELEEVFLLPGLDAPDGDGWDNRDPVGEWLDGGRMDNGLLFCEVPVDAVRLLIEEHGGEHAEQDDWPQSGPGQDGATVAEGIETPERDGGRPPVPLDGILYRVRLVWPDAGWVLREPPTGKPSLTWRGGPGVEEVAEELRWPDIVMTRTT